MDRMADIGRPFLKGSWVPHQVEYFQRPISQGSLYQHINRILVYVLFIRRYLMETGRTGPGVYGQMASMAEPGGPKFPPLVLAVLPFLGAVLARCVNRICRRPSSPV